MGSICHKLNFNDISSPVALFHAWLAFRRGKERKEDVQKFGLSLEDNIIGLHEELEKHRYRHGDYIEFYINDPKLRRIHKAAVRDRVIHHAVLTAIEPFFERHFIFDSYSSRVDKGTYAAVRRLQRFIWRISRNDTKRVWVLQCDIRKFFDSVDHGILFGILSDTIYEPLTLDLLHTIITSYNGTLGKGIPLGNVTSQLFSNIYLNELDQFMKRDLRTQYYLRYADDFVIASRDREYLLNLIPKIKIFLAKRLELNLHERKIVIRPAWQGIDFLGFIIFPYHIVLRPRTKKRMLRQLKTSEQLYKKGAITAELYNASLQSYRGMLQHCRAHRLSQYIDIEYKLNNQCSQAEQDYGGG
ncbi:MAG: RNA-dependent DNA polymerase [Parcubacteria group bacterium]|nr:MAG: RNA-dependent DNA polymerase [Parcubacteria group bacterium]